MASQLAKQLREKLDQTSPSLSHAINDLKKLNSELAEQNAVDQFDDECTPVTHIEALMRNGRLPRST